MNGDIADRYTRRALALLRFVNGLEADNASLLRDLGIELRLILSAAAVEFPSMGRRALAALIADLGGAVFSAYEAIAADQWPKLIELAEIDALWASGAGAAPRVASKSAIERAMGGLLVQGAPLPDQWERQAQSLAWRIGTEVREAATTGTPIVVVEQSVVGDARTLRGGLIERARNDAAALTDTAVHTAAYAGRLATWRASGVNALEWFAILDGKTTIGCAVRAGKLYSIDLVPIGHAVPIERPPPRHWRCRSILLPHKFPNGPPADGGPQRDSFEAWLSKKSPAEQDEILGKGRAALWRNGTITLADLIGQRGQTLTLAELRSVSVPLPP